MGKASEFFDAASYEDCKELMGLFPMTWYPALMMEMVEAAYKKKVFVPGGASTTVARIEDKIGKGKPNGPKRED